MNARKLRQAEVNITNYVHLSLLYGLSAYHVDLENQSFEGRIILPSERDKEVQHRLRWGIGRVVTELEHDPLVFPIWINGFDDINPFEKPYWKYTSKRILGPPLCLSVTVGEPIEVGSLKRRLLSSLPDNTNFKLHLASNETTPCDGSATVTNADKSASQGFSKIIRKFLPNILQLAERKPIGEPVKYLHDGIYVAGKATEPINNVRANESDTNFSARSNKVVKNRISLPLSILDPLTFPERPLTHEHTNPALDYVHSALTAFIQEKLYGLKTLADQQHRDHKSYVHGNQSKPSY